MDDTTPSNEESPAEDIHLVVEKAQLPNGESERETIINELGELVVKALRENHDVQSEGVSVEESPFYMRISDNCPECNAQVELRDITAGQDGIATASGNCSECKWSGKVEFALIDFFGGTSPHEERKSAVRQGKTTPRSLPY